MLRTLVFILFLFSLAKPHSQRRLQDNCVWTGLSFTMEV